MAISVIVNKPDGGVETLALDPPAALQAYPGVIFEFPDLDSSQVEFQAAGTPPLPHPLHADLGLLAQHDRALLRRDHPKTL